jgi:hypothetical protein
MLNAGMLLTLERKLTHLALDHPRVAPVVPRGQTCAADLRQHPAVQVFMRLGIGDLELVRLAPDDPQRIREAQAVGIEMLLFRASCMKKRTR